MSEFKGEPGAGGGRASTSTRREAILSLVEMLLKQGDDNTGSGQQPIFEDDKDVPSVDEHNQTTDVEAFKRFQQKLKNLDNELRNFSLGARHIGSSAAVISSAFHLRTRIAHISYLYSLNASDLYPRKIESPASAHVMPDIIASDGPKPRRKYLLSRKHRALPHVARPTVDTTIELEDFPNQFEALADEVTTFVNCLNEFPEFTDEAVNVSILSFEQDLKYWASCLHRYSGQFRYPAVQRYVQDLALEMGEHIDNVTSTLSMFIEVGIPAIRFSQRNSAGNTLNLSGVAAFFSGVTATTLQFSYQLRSPTANAVNLFWFLSLVFSIAATVNSLLGSTWKMTMYRSPRHRVPWWVLLWIKRFPLIFLVLSAVCFSIGLCLFAYASGQPGIVATATTVSTGFTAFGVAAVSMWFAFERWAFTHHHGKKWVGDVLAEMNENFLNLPGITLVRRGLHRSSRWGSVVVSRAGTKIHDVTSITKGIMSSHAEGASDSKNGLPTAMPLDDGNISSSGRGCRRSLETGPSSPIDSPMSTGSSTPMGPGSPPHSPSSPTAPSIGRASWKNALRTIEMSSVMTHPIGPRSPHRQRTNSSTLVSLDRWRVPTEPPMKAMVRSRVAALVPRLRSLKPTQDIAAHQAPVRHLQFSPDGKFLATSSWDKTSVIFRVESSIVSQYRTLTHAKGVVGQVAWSPTGHLLLTKLDHGVEVWTPDGVCQRTIDRPAYVNSITWFPGGEAFLSVEGSTVAKVNLKGKVLGTYNFGSIKLQDVTVTPDGARLLGVGPLLQSPDGLLPSKSREEKQLAILNMDTGEVEHATPVLSDVKNITLARNTRNGIVALVSYENKAPPQLWKLEIVKDVAGLTLRHTFILKSPVEFAGPSSFGGRNDELVLCAGKAGDIHIWDQESGSTLHHIRAQDLSGDFTCTAWNHAEDNPFMFATGSHDGTLRIWTKRPERRPSLLALEIPFTRSSSPEDMDDIPRTETPLTQQGFESSFANSVESWGLDLHGRQ